MGRIGNLAAGQTVYLGTSGTMSVGTHKMEVQKYCRACGKKLSNYVRFNNAYDMQTGEKAWEVGVHCKPNFWSFKQCKIKQTLKFFYSNIEPNECQINEMIEAMR